MEEVFRNLGKKDSLKVLVEQYESTLHRAEDLQLSASCSDQELLAMKDLEEDDYSRIVNADNLAQYQHHAYLNSKKFDRKIMELAM